MMKAIIPYLLIENAIKWLQAIVHLVGSKIYIFFVLNSSIYSQFLIDNILEILELENLNLSDWVFYLQVRKKLLHQKLLLYRIVLSFPPLSLLFSDRFVR